MRRLYSFFFFGVCVGEFLVVNIYAKFFCYLFLVLEEESSCILYFVSYIESYMLGVVVGFLEGWENLVYKVLVSIDSFVMLV